MKRKALCVGVNKYKDKKYVDLRGSHKDATTITSALEYPPEDSRFDVTYLTDPAAAEVEDALRTLVEEIDEESFLVFYFAGHGLTLPYQTGQSLLCSDASPLLVDGKSFVGAIQPVTLQEIAQNCRGKLFTLLDTCRSATAVKAKGMTPQEGGKATRDAMATAAAKAGLSGICWALNSTKDGCLASDDGSFARAVASVMREAVDHSLELRLGEIFVDRVIEKMREFGNATQLPEASGTGFVLVPGQKGPSVDERVEALDDEPENVLARPCLDDSSKDSSNIKQFSELVEETRSSLQEQPDNALNKGNEATPGVISGQPEIPISRRLAPLILTARKAGARMKLFIDKVKVLLCNAGARMTPSLSKGKSQNRRLTSAEGLARQAKEAFDAGRFKDAKRLAKLALDDNPENTLAGVVMDNLSKRNRIRKFLRLTSEGRRLLRTNPDKALEKASEALQYFPVAEEATRLEEAAKKKQRENKKSEALRKVNAELQEGRNRLRNNPAGALSNARFAAEICSQRREDPDFEKFAEEAKRLESDALERRVEVEREYERSKVSVALKEGWNSLKDNDPDAALSRAREAKARCAGKSGEPEFRGFAEEVARLENEALARKDDLDVKAMLRDARELFKLRKYLEAFTNVNAILKRRPQSLDAQALERKLKKRLHLKAGRRMTLNIGGTAYVFRWIPAGSFTMGSPTTEKGRSNDEVQHRVNISRGFWMLETPVTQGMWKSAMGNNPSRFTGTDRLPVEYVSWNDCREYVEKLNELCDYLAIFDLPTEAEWEYACRAGTSSPFSFGNSLNGDKANCNGLYSYGTRRKGKFIGKTTEVRKRRANAWGLYDMHGNVWEWTSDWRGAYATGEVADPTGPKDGSERVFRGGCWDVFAVNCRSACRCSAAPDYRNDVGVRLVLRPFF